MTSQPAVEEALDLEAMRREVERHKDELVEKAEGFFEERRDRAQQDLEIEVVPIERSQLENVLRLSLGTPSVKEVINFIRYQMGRVEGWNNGSFGRALIDRIEREIVPLGSHAPIQIRLVRYFLGYLIRAMRYYDSEQKALAKLAETFPDRQRLRQAQESLLQLFRNSRSIIDLQGLLSQLDKLGDFGELLKGCLEKATQIGWDKQQKLILARLFLTSLVREAQRRGRGGERR